MGKLQEPFLSRFKRIKISWVGGYTGKGGISRFRAVSGP
jgi:hypothetical protein